MEIREPKTPKEFESYYALRYNVLRKPWKQPKGSEKDEMEDGSVHIMAMDSNIVLGVGRLHLNSNDEAQVRYMAVSPAFQGRGVGTKILKELEKAGKKKGAKYIVLNSREEAVHFYEKNGYAVIGDAPTLFNVVKHKKMKKEI
jgi:ribosomal protein S18 acetylase RimI-like enzyme